MPAELCSHTRADGQSCGGRAAFGSPFCSLHDEARREAINAGRSKGGAAPRRKVRRLPNLLDHSHVGELLSETLVEALNSLDPSDPRQLQAINSLARTLLQVVGRPKNSYYQTAAPRDYLVEEATLCRLYPPDPEEEPAGDSAAGDAELPPLATRPDTPDALEPVAAPMPECGLQSALALECGGSPPLPTTPPQTDPSSAPLSECGLQSASVEATPCRQRTQVRTPAGARHHGGRRILQQDPADAAEEPDEFEDPAEPDPLDLDDLIERLTAAVAAHTGAGPASPSAPPSTTPPGRTDGDLSSLAVPGPAAPAAAAPGPAAPEQAPHRHWTGAEQASDRRGTAPPPPSESVPAPRSSCPPPADRLHEGKPRHPVPGVMQEPEADSSHDATAAPRVPPTFGSSSASGARSPRRRTLRLCCRDFSRPVQERMAG